MSLKYVFHSTKELAEYLDALALAQRMAGKVATNTADHAIDTSRAAGLEQAAHIARHTVIKEQP